MTGQTCGTGPSTDPDAGVVVVGDVLVDELVMPDGSRDRRPGGAGLNLALSVRRLGTRSSLAAPLAVDADGDWLAEVAQTAGVELIPLPNPGPTGVATSWRVDGEPVYHFSASVHERYYRWDDAASARVANAGTVLVVNSFPMHAIEQADSLADLVTRTGQLFVVDPNVRPSLLTEVSAYRTGLRRLAAVADVVKLSLQDIVELDIEDPDELVSDLLAGGVSVVLLTRGRHGASLLTGSGERIDVPAPDRPGAIVDTMGAGDATLAVLVAGIAREGVDLGIERWTELTVHAMDMAANVCRIAGGSLG